MITRGPVVYGEATRVPNMSYRNTRVTLVLNITQFAGTWFKLTRFFSSVRFNLQFRTIVVRRSM